MKKLCRSLGVLALALSVLPGLLRADVLDTVWLRCYAQPGYCNDEATAMFVDGAGNVYVTGSSQAGVGGYKDFATVKYNSAGVQQWAERYSGMGNSIPTDIVVDGAGNVYVTGGSESTGTGYDFLTVKYNSAGVLQWHDRYNGPGSGADWATAICLDSLGNVAVCGYVAGVSSSNDWTTIGYAPDGGRRFLTPRSSSGGNPDEANDIICDPQGNYYVAGRLWFPGNVDDAAVIKYNSLGVEQWVANYDGPLSGDGALAICRSAAGDFYVTGWSTGLNDNADVITLKVSAAGAVLWAARYAAPENGSDVGMKIAVDAQGNPRVLGRVQVGPGGDYDLVTLGYRADSVSQFTNRLNSGGSCTPGNIALDADGKVIICGALAGDYLTVQYSGSVEDWRRVENFGSGDAATAVAVDNQGFVYVTGRGDWGADAWNFTTIKYRRTNAVEEGSPALVSPDRAPTIVRGVLEIGSRLTADGSRLELGLLDISGRRVMDLRPGPNDVSRLAPGIYFSVVPGRSLPGRVVVAR